MPITEFLERNAREFGDDVCLVEINPDIQEKRRITWRDYELIESGQEERDYARMDYESGRGTSFIKGEDGAFDNVTVGINKAARKEKVRKAIQESKRKSRKAAKTGGKTSRSSKKAK